jgi:hypothetical protein
MEIFHKMAKLLPSLMIDVKANRKIGSFVVYQAKKTFFYLKGEKKLLMLGNFMKVHNSLPRR